MEKNKKGDFDKWIRLAQNKIDKDIDKEQDEKTRVTRIIAIASSVCAAIAVQPIPFADIFILTPVQALMAIEIGHIKGFSVTTKSGIEIIQEISGIVGLGYLAQQIAIGFYKFIPYLGAITTVPLVFSLTWAIGRTVEYYFDCKKEGRKINKSTVKNLFLRAREEGRKESGKYSEES